MIRHLVLIIDTSKVWLPDLKKLLEAFISDYFDQNPISQMSILVTHDGIAEKLTDFSGNHSNFTSNNNEHH